jgi:hypothetical protein
MNYKDLRPTITDISIFGTRDKSLISRLIRMFSKEWSHTGFICPIAGRNFVVEVREGHGCVMSLASQRFGEEDIIVVSLPQSKIPSLDSLLEDVGRIEYDYLGAIIAPFYQRKSNKEICSEWVGDKMGLKLGLKGMYLPADIIRFYNK